MKNAKIHIGDKLEVFGDLFQGSYLNVSQNINLWNLFSMKSVFYENRSNSHKICGWHKFGMVSKYAGWQNQVPKVLDKLKEWNESKLMKFNQGECNILYWA